MLSLLATLPLINPESQKPDTRRPKQSYLLLPTDCPQMRIPSSVYSLTILIRVNIHDARSAYQNAYELGFREPSGI